MVVAVSTITSKGQTTIPKSVRERLHLKTGDRLEFVARDDGTALMAPATMALEQLKASMPEVSKLLKLEEIDTAVRRHAALRLRSG